MRSTLPCRFVESHHLGEAGPPPVSHLPVSHLPVSHPRRTNPALAQVIDKLNADHVVVAGHLEQVEAAAKAPGELDTPQQRSRLVNALETLARDPLAHLDFEEEQIRPTLRTWTGWAPRTNSPAAANAAN